MTRMDQHSWKGSWWDWVWMGTSRSEFTTLQVERFSLTHLESVTCFPNVKNFTFFTLELVYEVGGFSVGKGGDGISGAGE